MALPIKMMHQSRLLLNGCMFPVLRASFSSAYSQPQQISSNLSYHATTEKILEQEQRPLILLYSWMAAKAKHMHKFGDFYLREGCDVLHIKLKPGQLLRPTQGHAVVKQVLDFAKTECPTQPLIAHGFSVGCYLYAETLVRILNDAQYRTMGDRILAQILDSPVDYKGIPYGVSNAVTGVPIVKKTMELSVRSYLAMFPKSVTRHYELASKTIKENAMNVPSLVLYSRADKVADPTTSDELIEMWQKQGVLTHSKCWSDSIHVGHYLKYPTEYLASLASFVQQILHTEQMQHKVVAQ